MGGPSGSGDSWDDYKAARNRVLDAVREIGLANLAVLTGDVHSSWAYDLVQDPFRTGAYDPATGRGALGVEIVTPAVTSPNSFGAGEVLRDRKAGLLKNRPHLRFVDAERGYVVVDVSAERLQADWWTVPTIARRTPEETFVKGLVSAAGRPHFVESGSPSKGADAPEPAPI
jgi:alkaline phosphatase D